MARLRHEQPQNEASEGGHFNNEASNLQMNLYHLNKLNQMKTASFDDANENTQCVIFVHILIIFIASILPSPSAQIRFVNLVLCMGNSLGSP